jgi:flagellar biosynthesis/type III secretory pathway protein FliH
MPGRRFRLAGNPVLNAGKAAWLHRIKTKKNRPEGRSLQAMPANYLAAAAALAASDAADAAEAAALAASDAAEAACAAAASAAAAGAAEGAAAGASAAGAAGAVAAGVAAGATTSSFLLQAVSATAASRVAIKNVFFMEIPSVVIYCAMNNYR